MTQHCGFGRGSPETAVCFTLGGMEEPDRVLLDRAVEDGRQAPAELFDAYCSRLVTAEAALFAFLVTRAVVGLATATDAAVVVQAATPARQRAPSSHTNDSHARPTLNPTLACSASSDTKTRDTHPLAVGVRVCVCGEEMLDPLERCGSSYDRGATAQVKAPTACVRQARGLLAAMRVAPPPPFRPDGMSCAKPSNHIRQRLPLVSADQSSKVCIDRHSTFLC